MITGLHHVTAIASDPQRNVDFYAGVLGLRLLKRTVNYDDPHTYHFYFGDAVGTPGSIMTFFPSPHATQGRQGHGQVAVTSFAVSPGAIGSWIARLIRYGIAYDGPTRRDFGAGIEQVLSFRDHDGLMLEIVGHPGAIARPVWEGARGIAPDDAIRGFHGVTIWVERGEATGRVLVDTLGFRMLLDDGSTRRYTIGDGGPGTFVDVREIGGFLKGLDGAGTVHHVAFTIHGDDEEVALRQRLVEASLRPTPVIDRTYFHSVYFREPGGVLYELATAQPGFAIDEPVAHLGESLMLPPQYESSRAELEAELPIVHLPGSVSPGSAFDGDGDAR